MAIIGDAGSAPDFQKQGYRDQGFLVHGTVEEVLNVFRTVDVVLVKAAEFSGTNNEHEFYPMFRELGVREFSNVMGRFIASARTNAGLSVAELAGKAQISEPMQKLIESGLARPNRQYMSFMVRIFGTNFTEQLTDALCS